MKKLTALAMAAVATTTLLSGCASKADVASKNLSTAADQFKINRKIIFINGITGDAMFEVDGYCSLGNDDPANRVSVTCETAPGQYKKSFVGISDNTTFIVQQVDPAAVGASHFNVIWRPSTLIPGVSVTN